MAKRLRNNLARALRTTWIRQWSHRTTSVRGILTHFHPSQETTSQTDASWCVNPTGDELPEFNRNVLEVLRQPLEDGQVTIARAAAALTYPAQFTLVSAMNPCPCGFYGDPVRACTCPKAAVGNYLNRISGPLLDRIDLHIEVPRLRQDELTSPPTGETSRAIRERVEKARAIQRKRFEKAGSAGIFCNARMSAKQLQTYCTVDPAARALLSAAIEQMNLSARAYDRILKVSRTIADLAGEETIGIAHIAEAIQYRALDRKFWGG